MADVNIQVNATDGASPVFENIGNAAETSWEKIAEGVVSGELMKDALEKLGEAGVEAFTKIAEAIPNLIEHTITVGNSLYEMSLKTGATVENLSALRYVASQTGMDFDSFGTILYRMENSLGSTGQKADNMQASLDRLHLSLNTLRDERPDQAFIDIISALEEIPNRADQANIAQGIFGRGAKEMAGLFVENIKIMMDEAKDLGLVMSTSDAAAAHAADVGFKAFEMQVEAVAMRFASSFMPGILAVTNILRNEFQQAVGAAGGKTIDMDGVVKTIIDTMLVWAENGVTVGKTIFDVLVNLMPIFEGLGKATINVAAAIVNLAGILAEMASYIPGLGDTFKGLHDALGLTYDGLHKAYDALNGLSAEMKASKPTVDATFDSMKAGVQTVRDELPGAFEKAKTEIDDYAKRSHTAFGAASTDASHNADDTKGSFDRILIGGQNMYADFQTIRKADLAEQKAVLLEHDEAFRVEWSNVRSGAVELNSFFKNERDDDVAHAKAVSIELANLNGTYNDLVMQRTLSTTDYQKAKVDEWRWEAIAQIDASGAEWDRIYEVINKTAGEKLANVTSDTKTMREDQKKILGDLTDGPGGFVETFSSILTKSGNTKDAIKGAWQVLVTDFQKLGGDMLKSIIDSFLQPLLDGVKSAASSITNTLIGAFTNNGSGWGSVVSGAAGGAGGEAGEAGAGIAGAAGLGSTLAWSVAPGTMMGGGVGAGVAAGLATAGIGAAVMGGIYLLSKLFGPSPPPTIDFGSPAIQTSLVQSANPDAMRAELIKEASSIGAHIVNPNATGVSPQYISDETSGRVAGFANEGYDIVTPTRAVVGDAAGQSESVLHASTVKDIVAAARNAGSAISTAALEKKLDDLTATIQTMLRSQPALIAHAMRSAR